MIRKARAGRDVIDARNSQGSVFNPTGPVTQTWHVWGGAGPPQLRALLQDAHLAPLLAIIARVQVEDVGEALYRACRASLAATAALPNTREARALIADISARPWNPAGPPLFECIERFALTPEIGATLTSDLQQWVDMAAGHVDPRIAPENVERLRRRIAAEVQEAGADPFSWLQVSLEPDPYNRTMERKQPLFSVELVLWKSSTGGAMRIAPASIDNTRAWPLDELPSLLNTVLSDEVVVNALPPGAQLMIEVVAPADVLLYGFDRWKYLDKDLTYGATFPVVVRLNRLTPIPAIERKRVHDFWRKKWDAFRRGVRLEGVESLTWLPDAQLDAIDLQDDDSAVCLGITSPLVRPNGSAALDVLRDAGIPIAIWLRGDDIPPDMPADWHEEVAKRMKDGKLCDLHTAIQELRRSKDARRNARHFFNALTLLWDDPDRLPPKQADTGVFT